MALRAILGDSQAASDAAAEHGIVIKPAAIDQWLKRYPDEFARIQESRLSTIRQEVISDSRTLLRKRNKVATKALEKLDDQVDLEELTAAQMASVLRAVDTGRSTDIESIRKLSVEAVAPAERQGYQELIAKLARTGVITVDNEADAPVIEAEVEDD